jgi:hypothetical protein
LRFEQGGRPLRLAGRQHVRATGPRRLFGAGAAWVLQDLTAFPALLAMWSDAV